MTVHVHKLEGCAPTPLARYLKALAVLRLVSEQRDATARGWWKDEAFWLATTLSLDELVEFFLGEYAPTPILSPWNGGSGFFYDNDPGLTPIENSVAPRFERFRRGIAAARSVSAPLAAGIAWLKSADDAADAADKAVNAATAAVKLARTLATANGSSEDRAATGLDELATAGGRYSKLAEDAAKAAAKAAGAGAVTRKLSTVGAMTSLKSVENAEAASRRADDSAAAANRVAKAAAITDLKSAEDAVRAAADADETAAEACKLAKAAKDSLKDAILAAGRRSWSGGLLEWFDAALALGADGDAAWPALLGSGGNDGRLDFTNNTMQHVSSLFDCADGRGKAKSIAPSLLAASLFGVAAPGLVGKAVGQFLPGSAGGDNMGCGFSGESLVNPWDFLLMLEGTIVLASSIVRSGDAANLPQAAAPFAVRSNGAGYGSASAADEGPRGEQWMPVWSRAALHVELRALFSEGRTRVGKRTSTRALDAARSVARLGAARGVSYFERYGYIERNGQANLAVPLGRWMVSAQPHEELLDDVDAWLGRLGTYARDKAAPNALRTAARALDEAALAVCRSGHDPRRWQALLIGLGRAEHALLQSPNKTGDAKRGLAPLPPLSPGWIAAADDGSRELRLAVALASQDVLLRHRGTEIVANVRAHWMPVERAYAPRHVHAGRSAARFATEASGLANDPDVVCSSTDLERDCIALVRRRVQIAATLSTRGLGLYGARGVEASLSDVTAFVVGAVDDARILTLARPLMALTWWCSEGTRLAAPSDEGLDAAYAILRIAHLSEPLDIGEKLTIRLDAEPVARLAAGDLAGAVAISLRRLRASGLSPVVRVVAGDSRRARRLAASLAFPIRPADARRCAVLVTKPYKAEETVHVR